MMVLNSLEVSMRNTSVSIMLGRNIRQQRHLAGLSLKAAGGALGITYQQMQKYETGINDISCEKMLQLATLFQCKINDLCDVDLKIPAVETSRSTHLENLLLSHFRRIESRKVRDKVCRLVQALVDFDASNSLEIE